MAEARGTNSPKNGDGPPRKTGNQSSLIWSTILRYPRPKDLAKITAPFVCTYGSRSPSYMRPITRALARAIPTAQVREIDGAAHAVTFDAPGNFVHVIGEAIRSSEPRPGT